MTDGTRTLVERLRFEADNCLIFDKPVLAMSMREAADALTAQAAEIERLTQREADLEGTE